MKIHEYQAKTLFKAHGVPVLRGHACTTAAAAGQAARELGSAVVVVKSQIHAGGRGKGTVYADAAMTSQRIQGGVKLARSAEEAEQLAGQFLGGWLKTIQTGDSAKQVHTVYVEDGCRIAKELYLSVLMDRAAGLPVMIASRDGGMDIEEVAEHHPERILKVHLDPFTGLADHQGRTLGFAMGLTPTQVAAFVKTAKAIAACFLATDADMLEINPLVVTSEDTVVALDGKMSFDDNALFRHPHIAAMIDPNEEDAAELEAKRHDMAFVKLDGNIGCLVNGAGLAMATMDAIALYGSAHGAFPANFLDVGGGATAEKVTTAFKIILKDQAVEAILVNIFGGIMKCDTIATGVLAAVREVGLDRPLVVRLEGTNVEAGKRLIAESGLAVIAADDLRDGCRKAAEAAQSWRLTRGLAPHPPKAIPAPIAYIPDDADLAARMTRPSTKADSQRRPGRPKGSRNVPKAGKAGKAGKAVKAEKVKKKPGRMSLMEKMAALIAQSKRGSSIAKVKAEKKSVKQAKVGKKVKAAKKTVKVSTTPKRRSLKLKRPRAIIPLAPF